MGGWTHGGTAGGSSRAPLGGSPVASTAGRLTGPLGTGSPVASAAGRLTGPLGTGSPGASAAGRLTGPEVRRCPLQCDDTRARPLPPRCTVVLMAVSDPTGIWDPSEPERILHYIAISRWGQEGLPPGGWFGRVSAVLQAPDGRVFVFQRGPASHDVTIFGPDEHAIGGWSADFGTEHGMRLGPDGHLWLTDVGRHRVLKATLDGEILLELGTRDSAGCDERTFNAPTDVSFAPDGSVYITDGYG